MAEQPDLVGVIERYVSLLGTPHVAEVVALFAEDATVEDPVGAELRQGHEALSEFFGTLPAVGVSARLTGPVRAAEREAAFPFHISSDGGFEMDVIDVMTFDDAGRITSMRAFWAMG